MPIDKKYLADVSERVVATAVEAGISYGIVELANIKASWVIPLTAVLAYAKSLVAKFIGNKDSASLTKSV